MKVLYVIDSLAPGGTERSTVTLLPWLEELGVEATIAVFREADHDLRGDAEASGAEVTVVESRSFGSQVRAVRRLIRSQRPDVVHTALFKADQVGRLAALGTGVPVVSSFVSTPYDEHRLRDPNVRRWKLRLVQVIDAATAHLSVTRFHAVSEGVRDENCRALRISTDRVVVAERGRSSEDLGECDDQLRADVRSTLRVDEFAPLVLNVGRLDEQKGQLVLLDAVGRLRVEQPRLRLAIAGKDGSAAARIRERVEEDPVLASGVALLGHRSDIGALLCAADVLVVSSHFEGTAGAAIEAMAVGTPVVSTDMSGAKGILRDRENSLLVRVGDPSALADAITSVLDDEDLAERLRAAGQYDFTTRFTMDMAARRLFELYRSVS